MCLQKTVLKQWQDVGKEEEENEKKKNDWNKKKKNMKKKKKKKEKGNFATSICMRGCSMFTENHQDGAMKEEE